MITNKQKRRAYYQNQEYKRLTRLYKLIERFQEIINTLDEDTKQAIHEEWNTEDTPEANAFHINGHLLNLYTAIRSVRRAFMK